MSSPLALVIGGSGLVGGAICRALGDRAVGTHLSRSVPGLRHLDAADGGAVASLLEEVRPLLVFFAAAQPNVDRCEQHPDEARELNRTPALSALEATKQAGARFVFFSTDYVFDGEAGPYDESAEARPVSVYGRIKREIEEHVLAAGQTVIRTTTVFGSELPPGKNFALRVIRELGAGRTMRVATDQVSTPTWADELACGAIDVASQGGIWNVAGPDLMSRDEFARATADVFGLDATLIEPVPTSALGQVAARPLRGGLRTDKLNEWRRVPLTPTRIALDRFRRQGA